MATRHELLKQLQQLSYAQFEEVMFRLEIEPWNLPGPIAEQNLRAMAMLKRMEQEDNGLQRLADQLSDNSITVIGKQYEGYETEVKVREVIQDYTTQPFVGRSPEQSKINSFLEGEASGLMLMTAPAGYGKSSLLMHWQQTCQEDYFIAFHCFRRSSLVLESLRNAYRHLLRQLYVYYNRRAYSFPDDLRSQLCGLIDQGSVQPDRRLVIVLDGLDEAETIFEPFFPSELPKGVYVIASARAEEGDEPEYLRGWVPNATLQLNLKRLPQEAIADWIVKIDDLIPYASNSDFIKELDVTTAGFPLYLGYLLNDLQQAVKQNQNPLTLLTDSPKGFAAYVKEQFRLLAQVDELRRQNEVQELFALLTVAKGTLSEDDIEKLTELTAWDLNGLPWQVTRWFSIRSGAYSFAHPLLAQEFQAVLGKQATAAAEKLTNYCANNWSDRKSHYALRYYADHLWDSNRWDDLYELARDEMFAQAQRDTLFNEPELQLKTIKLALKATAEADDAVGMAKFLLSHAGNLVALKQQSPLDMLRAENLEGAWALADQFELENCILWHLLLAWVLVLEAAGDEHQLELARKTLQRLQQKGLIRFDTSGLFDSRSNIAINLLTQILPTLEEVPFVLPKQILNDACISMLCQYLVGRDASLEVHAQAKQIEVAIKAAQLIDNPYRKSEALSTIAIAQAKIQFLEEAIEITQQISESHWHERDNALCAIVQAQIEIQQFESAIKMAKLIYSLRSRAEILTKIFESQAKAGQIKESGATLQMIIKTLEMTNDSDVYQIPEYRQDLLFTAQLINEESLKDKDLAYMIAVAGQKLPFRFNMRLPRDIRQKDYYGQVDNTNLSEVDKLLEAASVCIKKQQFESAKSAFEEAIKIQTLQRLTPRLVDYYNASRAEALAAIAEVQVQAQGIEYGQSTFEVANKAAQLINEIDFRADALGAIAKAQAKTQQFEAAIKTTQLINDFRIRDCMLEAISLAQIKAEQFDSAIETTQLIDISFTKAELLAKIKFAMMKMALLQVEQTEESTLHAFDLCLKAGKVSETLNEIISSTNHPSALVRLLTFIAESASQNELFEQSPDFLKLATKHVALVKDKEPTTKHYLLKKIARVYAQAHQFEEAIATAYMIEVNNDYRAEALIAIATTQAQVHDFKSALKTTQLIGSSKCKAKALNAIAKTQAQANDFKSALETTQLINDLILKVRAFLNIALCQFKAEQLTDARSSFANAMNITTVSRQGSQYGRVSLLEQSTLLKEIVVTMLEVGLNDEALSTAKIILTDRNRHLPEIAAVFAKAGDREGFKQLLIPCADYLDATYQMCAYLAKLYPSQASDVAKVVSEFSVN